VIAALFLLVYNYDVQLKDIYFLSSLGVPFFYVPLPVVNVVLEGHATLHCIADKHKFVAFLPQNHHSAADK